MFPSPPARATPGTVQLALFWRSSPCLGHFDERLEVGVPRSFPDMPHVTTLPPVFRRCAVLRSMGWVGVPQSAYCLLHLYRLVTLHELYAYRLELGELAFRERVEVNRGVRD